MTDFLIQKPVSQLLEGAWRKEGHTAIAERRKRAMLSANYTPDTTWVVTEDLLTKDNPDGREIALIQWVKTYREDVTPEARQLANYRLIFALFQSPTPCYHLDCRLQLTKGHPEKMQALHDFMEWVGAYYPLQVVTFHHEDGAVPPALRAVFEEHQFLHHALNAKIHFEWAYFFSYLQDIVQQSFLTSLWLLDRVGQSMVGKNARVTPVRDWSVDNGVVFEKIQHWPESIKRYQEGSESTASAAAEVSIDTAADEWQRCERAIYTSFETIQISLQTKMARILTELPRLSQENPRLAASLNAYITHYQFHEKSHQSLLRLSPSALAEYSAQITSLTLPGAPTFFNAPPRLKSRTYDALPQCYHQSAVVSFPSLSAEGRLNALDALVPALMAEWETPTTNKASLSPIEEHFIVQSLLYPDVGRLSLEHLSLSAQGQSHARYFMEQLLTYNPHMTEIITSGNEGLSASIQACLHKNQQRKAALYYASLSPSDYEACRLGADLSEAQRYRQSLATNEAEARRWLETALTHLSAHLPKEEHMALKKSIEEQYLPIIHALEAHKETPIIKASMRYADVFEGCKPAPEKPLNTAEIRAMAMSLH